MQIDARLTCDKLASTPFFLFAELIGVTFMAFSVGRIRLRKELSHRQLRFETLEWRTLLAGDLLGNHVPVPENDHYTLVQDTPLIVHAAGVLSNDITE